MADQKGFPDKPAKAGAVTLYTIQGRDGVPKMVRPEDFPALPAPAHRFDHTDLFTRGQMWEYIEAERELAAGEDAPAEWSRKDMRILIAHLREDTHFDADLIEQMLAFAQRVASAGGQPDAWQMRRYYTGDDAGWGLWKECSAEEAAKWKGRSDIQVRPLYANAPPPAADLLARNLAARVEKFADPLDHTVHKEAGQFYAAVKLLLKPVDACATCKDTGRLHLTGPGGGEGTCPDCHGEPSGEEVAPIAPAEPARADDALLIDNLFRATLGRDSTAIDTARMALRRRFNELRAAARKEGSSDAQG